MKIVVTAILLGITAPVYAQSAAEKSCTGNNPVCQLPTADGDDASAPTGVAHAFATTIFKDGQITSQLYVCSGVGRDTCVGAPWRLGPVPGHYIFGNKTRIGNLSYSDRGTRIYGTATQEGKVPEVFSIEASAGKPLMGVAGSAYTVVTDGPLRGNLAVTSADGKTISVDDPNTGKVMASPVSVADYKAKTGKR